MSVSALSRDNALAARIRSAKRMQSRIANKVRSFVLRDSTRDTGCGLKAFRRDVFPASPYLDGLHRFLPALVRREGYEIGYVDVIDRPRHAGVSNYGMRDRLWVGHHGPDGRVVVDPAQEERAGCIRGRNQC